MLWSVGCRYPPPQNEVFLKQIFVFKKFLFGWEKHRSSQPQSGHAFPVPLLVRLFFIVFCLEDLILPSWSS